MMGEYDSGYENYIDGLIREIEKLQDENDKLSEQVSSLVGRSFRTADKMSCIEDDNAKLREQLERLQPTDCEGNVLDIADTAHMLRSEYDGDHEWEDVVTELVLTKWGGDRWIVRGSKGEAWACDCTKTGHDEDAYEASDDVEPFDDATLAEAENAKLRELVVVLKNCADENGDCDACPINNAKPVRHPWFGCDALRDMMCELGMEVDE